MYAPRQPCHGQRGKKEVDAPVPDGTFGSRRIEDDVTENEAKSSNVQRGNRSSC